MGLSNKVAFVEVTNPSNPDWFASVNHTNSTWCDIKVYQDVAYSVTEASGTGIQVIDMSDIDNHNVTLVRTIGSPSRSSPSIRPCFDADAGSEVPAIDRYAVLGLRLRIRPRDAE